MKKIFIISIVATVGVLSLSSVLSSAKKISAQSLSVANPTLSSSSLPDYLGSASEVFGNSVPTGATLDIGTSQGTVTMNNFYANNPPVDLSQYIVFKITQNYIFDYDPTDSSFWIGVNGIPFSNWQAPLEQDFLTTLNISKADACKLSVVEGVIYDPNNPDNGKSFPLSFCNTPLSP